MIRRCWILLFGLICHTAVSQPAFQISGQIVDTVGVGLSFATIQLIEGKDTSITVTRDDGYFTIHGERPKKFSIYVTMKGYMLFSKTYYITEDRVSVQLGSIILHVNYNDLDPVVVSHMRPITIDGDTVSYRTASFPVRDGAEVEDILKRLPGIEVDLDGSIIVQGKKVTKILVNGKEYFGGDVFIAIQNLPANIIEKIQIIDDYGDKARLTGVKSGEAEKVLNIVLKADKQKGLLGKTEVGAGNNNRYLTELLVNDFNHDRQLSAIVNGSNNSFIGNSIIRNGGLSYADQWNRHLGGAINLNSSSQNAYSETNTLSSSFYPNQELQLNQSSKNSSNSQNNNLNSTLTFKPDPYSTFRLITNGFVIQSSNSALSNINTSQSDSGYKKLTTGQQTTNAHSKSGNVTSNLYYEQLSPYSRRRFSIQANINYSTNLQPGDTKSSASIVTDSGVQNSLVNYLTNNSMHAWNTNLSCTYFLPLGPTAFLNIGYRLQKTISSNYNLTQSPDSLTGALLTIDSLSQNILLQSEDQNYHVEYIGKLKKLNVAVALDAQPGSQKGTVDAKGNVIDNNYFNLLPNIQGAVNVDRTQKINFHLSSQPNLPSLTQLAPLINVTNPQYPVMGNPALKPSYTYNINLHYEKSEIKPTQFCGWGLGISYSYTRNSIIQELSIPKDSSQVIQATSYKNAGNTNNISADYHFNLPYLFKKRLRIYYNGTASAIQTFTMTNNTLYPTQTLLWSQTIRFQLMIPDLIESEAFMSYSESNTSYKTNNTMPNSSRSASIGLNSKHVIFTYWALNYHLAELYTSTGSELKTGQVMLSASIDRFIFRHNMGTVKISGFNLLNYSAVEAQSASPTTITHSSSTLNGRYFLLSLSLKLQHFRN